MLARRTLRTRTFGRWFRRRFCLVQLLAVLIFWPLSYFVNAGFGLLNGNPSVRAWGVGAAPNSTCFEVTLARGGMLLVINGTRTDGIYYNTSSGSTSWGWPIYFLLMENTNVPAVWFPSYARPAPWCGPYILVPWWLVVVPSALLARWGLRSGPAPPGKCTTCGYELAGLPCDAACPECGSHQWPAIKQFSSRPPLNRVNQAGWSITT